MPFSRRTGPVSYTHLRYRKMLGIIVLMLTITLIGVVVSATVLYKRKHACKTPDTILVAVSYTHLDVYKRQVPFFPLHQ